MGGKWARIPGAATTMIASICKAYRGPSESVSARIDQRILPIRDNRSACLGMATSSVIPLSVAPSERAVSKGST